MQESKSFICVWEIHAYGYNGREIKFIYNPALGFWTSNLGSKQSN